MGGFPPLYYQARVSTGLKLCEEALRIAEGCGDAHTKGIAWSAYGTAFLFKGDFEKAFQFLSEAIVLCRKSGHSTWEGFAEFWLGNAYYFSREYKKAQGYFRDALATLKNPDEWPIKIF